MAMTADAIGAIIGRYNQTKLNPQVYLSAGAVGDKLVKRSVKPNKRGVIHIKGGGLAATKNIADGGTLPEGSQKTIATVNYDPVAIVTRLQVPRVGSAMTADVEDGVDNVLELMKTAGEDLGRQLGRQFYKGSLGSPAAQVTAGSSTFTVSDPSGFKEGMSVDVYNTSEEYLETVVVADVAIPTSGNSTITLESTNTVQWETTAVLWLQGAKEETMVSLTDVCTAGSLYGKSHTTDNWSGNLDSTTTTFTPEDLKALAVRVRRRSGKKPTHVLCNEVGEQRIYESMDDGIRYIQSMPLDQYGFKLAFDGLPVYVDSNCPDGSIFLFNKDFAELHLIRDFAPEMDGGKKSGMNRGSVIVSDSTLTYDVQIWGAGQFRFENRAVHGHMSALTA